MGIITLDPATQILTNLALLLLLGLLISIASKKLKIPNILLLLIVGIIIGLFFKNDKFQFDNIFLVSIAILTLAMVVFDGASRFNLKHVSETSWSAFKVTLIFLFLNLIFITLFTSMIIFQSLSVESLLFSLLFAFVISGTDPGSVFILLKNKTNRVIEILEVEAIANTPITVIFPFIILDMLSNLHEANVATVLAGQLVPLLQQIVVGIGAGMVIGIIVFKTMRKFYSKRFSPVALITSALLAYILAANLEGNGVLAVATLGIVFGNIYVKQKETLQAFSSMLNSSLLIIVFLLIGLIINIELSIGLLLQALLIFVVLILTRLVAIAFAFPDKENATIKFNPKEKFFMACSMPKGIAAAVVAFSLSVFAIPDALVPMMDTTVALIVIMMLYSLILSSVIDRFSLKLIRIKLEEKK